ALKILKNQLVPFLPGTKRICINCVHSENRHSQNWSVSRKRQYSIWDRFGQGRGRWVRLRLDGRADLVTSTKGFNHTSYKTVAPQKPQINMIFILRLGGQIPAVNRVIRRPEMLEAD